MKYLMRYIYFLAFSFLSLLPAHAEPYHLVAGSSSLGFNENDKQNINLGFNSAFNELLTTENVKCDFKSFDSSNDLANAVKNNQVNAFFGSPLEFLNSEPYFLSSPIGSGVFDGQLKSKILLVVRKDSGIDSLFQLKNKTLARQKWILEDIAGLYLETLLLENKLATSEHFFMETQNTETSNRALIDLFFKKADVALVSESLFNIAAELNPQLRAQTKILVSSEPYLIFISALTKNTPAEEVDGIKESLLTIHKTARGRQIMKLMKFQSFQEIPLSDLDNVRALMAKYQSLKAKKNTK